VPSTLHDIDFMVKDGKRFADRGGWGYAEFEYEAATDTFRLGTLAINRRRGTTQVRVRVPTVVKNRTTFSRSTQEVT